MLKILRLIVALVVIKSIVADVDVERDAKLTTPELIAAYGYPVEVHNVTTPDGYILQLHRIPAPGKQPVLLMHGIFDSSSAWVQTGPGLALGYILYDLGYDVWLGNARGNTYSKKHVKYDPEIFGAQKQKYWDFSWHEIGKFDLPTFIDFIIETTSFAKIHYIGHSQGTTSYFVMVSERPEYNDKILLMTAMAPPEYMGNSNDPLIQLAVKNMDFLQFMAKILGIYEINPDTLEFVSQFRTCLCDYAEIKDTSLCHGGLNTALILYQTSRVNRTIMPILEGHLPSSASLKQLIHYGQLIRSNRFCQYDNGAAINKQIYGTATPPDYNLKAATAPVAMFYADGDVIVNPKDAIRTRAALPNVVEFRRINNETFNHYDFIVAADVNPLVYDFVIDLVQKMDNAT